MEPLSIATACLGALGTISRLSVQVTGFVSSVRSARKDMDAVSRELSSLSMCLAALKDDSENVKFPDTLLEIVTSCDNVARQIEEKLDDLKGGRLTAGLRWTLADRDEINKLRSSLESHKSAMNLALDMASLQIISDVKTDTSKIKADTSAIKQDTAHITTLMKEISLLRLQVSELRQMNGSGGFILERFLDASTAYAGSVVDSADLKLREEMSSDEASQEDIPQPPLWRDENSRISERAQNKETKSLDATNTSSQKLHYWPRKQPTKEVLTSDGTERTRELAGQISLPKSADWSDATSRAVRAILVGHSETVVGVAFSPDGRSLASASCDRTIRIWDAVTGAAQATLVGHSEAVWGLAFSPDGRRLASVSKDRTVRLWNAATGAARGTLMGHSDTVAGVAFSPDGQWLASVSKDRTIQLWDALIGVGVTLEGHSNAVYCVAFSPDGRSLASASKDRTIRLWDLATRTARATLVGHTDTVAGVAFSPDGRWLASASKDRTVRLWDAVTGAAWATLGRHTEAVWGVAFSPDGRWLASASEDQTILLWDATMGVERAMLVGHSGAVHGVAFSPDGWSLASASGDGTIRLWDPYPPKLGRLHGLFTGS